MAQITGLLPSKGKDSTIDANVQSGVEALVSGQYKLASESFRVALRFNPQNSYVQFLNGLSYHLMAETGNVSQYEFARTGYELALKFNKSNWLAAKQLARLYLKTKNYTMAQEFSAYVLLYQPDDAQALYCLAQASYYAQDLETAAGAIKRAQQLSPDDPDILAAASMISAASGNPEEAGTQLDRFKAVEPDKARIEHIAERVRTWLKHNENAATAPIENGPDSDNENPAVGAQTQKKDTHAEVEENKHTPRMVIIDVVMIRTEESEDTSKGVNLLEGLQLQFSDAVLGYVNTFSNVLQGATATTDTHTRTVSGKLSLSDVKYNLNIFCMGEDRTEVLARPTLVALDGQKSTFFSGDQYNVAVAGSLAGGTLEKVDVGLKLEVTPKFTDNDTILIDVLVSRNFIDLTGKGGSFKESMTVSKNEVSASVALKYGQTLIMSGLREKQTTEGKSGVPVLRDLPLVQYLFSTETSRDYHKSIITIITPRPVTPDVYVSSAAVAETGVPATGKAESMPYLEELKKSSSLLLSVDDNMRHVLRHLGKHLNLREFRDADLFDKAWYGSTGDLGSILTKTLSFIYY
jgi:general secretion pathway protein D